MPSATAPGFTGLFDSRGNLIQSGPQGTAWRRTADDDRLRPAPKNHYGDWIDLLTSRDSRRLVSESRATGTRGQPFSLLDQKADYVAASDFRPQFKGTDTAYGTAALPLLESYLQIANLRGWLFDWKTSWRLTIPLMATDARVYVLLTRWENGMPALQFLERHRIGQREDKQEVGADDAFTLIDENGTNKKIRGAYKGLRIKDGIITTPAGTEVAYRVLGNMADGSADQDISARDLFPICRPAAFSDGAGVPELARALFDFIGLELAQSAQLDQQIEDARLTLIETNASGKYDPSAGFGGGSGMATGTSGATETVEAKRGRTRFVKTGYSVTAHESERPSDQWMNFDARTHSRGAAAIRWRSEMLDPAALKAAANRALQDQINTLIRESFGTVEKAATRALNYISAVLSSPEIGYLPINADSMRWGIAPPPWFEVDRASAKYDLDDVAAGRTAMRTLRERDGKTSIEVMRARAHDYLEAKQVETEFPGVPLDYIMGDGGNTVQRTGGQPTEGDQQKAA